MAAARSRPTVQLAPGADTARMRIAIGNSGAAAPLASAATPLDEATTAQLLGRLDPLPDLAAINAHAPAVRPASLPPPRSGGAQPITFFVPAGKPVGDGPLAPPAPPRPVQIAPLAPPEILPRGEVRGELVVRVRFAEPMIAVAQVGTVAIPSVTLAPAVPGTWKWLDTRVLTFEAAGTQLPRATAYTVTVPAGTTAVSGAKLAADATGTFSTQPLQITGAFPREVRTDAPVAILFDQAFDPARVAKLLTLSHRKGGSIPFQVIDRATAIARLRNDPSHRYSDEQFARALGKNLLFIAPTTAWPADRELSVTLARGAPSAEGPLVTKDTSRTDFQVIRPFTVLGFACNGDETPRLNGRVCPANSFGQLVFSNAVELTSYRSELVQLEGEELEDHSLSGDEVYFSVPAVAGRTYAIRISEGLIDRHGQPLVGARRSTFTTTREVFASYLSAHTTGLTVLDPRFEIPQWVLQGQAIANLRVQLYKVTPADYFAYEEYESGARATPPGTRVFDKSYAVGARRGIDVRVDLRPALAAEGVGHVIAIATADGKRPLTERAWLQVTKLATVARIDRERVSAWVQDLAPDRFLAPRSTASAQLLVEHRAAAAPVRADAEGHVAFELPPPPSSPAPTQSPSAVLAITDGPDSTFTAIGRYEKSTRTHMARWYVTDDRFTYKPDEKVYVKGWVRWTHDGPNPDLALPTAGESVAWELTDARGNKLASGSAPLSSDGGFDLETQLPKTVNLGTATFALTARGQRRQHPIKIEEFRTPTFSVSLNDDVSYAGSLPLVVGESIEMQTDATYYAGGGLGGSLTWWAASLETTTYRPPNWNQFGFAPPVSRSRLRGYGYYDSDNYIHVQESTRLSGASSSTASIEIAALAENRPGVLTVETLVVDVDRQRIRAESRPILVHPSNYYVGVRKRPGTTTALEVIVTDIDGEPVPGVRVEVALEGVLGSERFRDDAKVVHTQSCTLTSATTPVPCEYTVRDDKTVYVAIASVTDTRGRTNRTQYQIPWWEPEDQKRDFWVTTDQKEYRPGDVAKLEIHSALVPATAIVTFARQGIITDKRVELATESTIVNVPVDESYMTNFFVVVDRVATRPTARGPKPGPLPVRASTQIDLPVDLESARLVMKTRATTPVIEPGENATFEVEVRHADKPMANAEVALMVVDEAVLALSKTKHGDPLPGFYARVQAGVDSASTHGLVHDAGADLLGKPGVDIYQLDALRGGSGSGWGTIGSGRYGMVGRGAASPSVRVGTPVVMGMRERQDFRPNAVFSPRLHTDANGKVRVSVKMPDSLTRFRIVAVATANTRYFGKAENTIVAQRRLNARTQAPRFLTQGDAFELPVMVQNLDAEPRTIDVAVRAANLESRGPMGKRVTVPAGQRTEVRFPFATRERGKAMIQTIVASGTFSDASRIELPVYVPATTESFATYGTVDAAPQYEQLTVPSSIFTDVGGVEVEVSSTQMQALTDAYWYLFAYPHECAEQRSSRMLATAAIFDVLEAFATPGRPSKADIETQRELDVKKLAAQQNADGGFGYFNGMSSDAFVTMQVVSALVASKHAGPMLDQATRNVEDKVTALLDRLGKDVAGTPNQARRDALPYDITLAATGLGSLAQAGRDVTTRALKLHAHATALKVYPVEAKARLLALLAGNARAKVARAALRTQLLSAIQETASVATVTTSYVEAERLLLVSNARTTALVLDALIREEPEHPLIGKLARGLLDGRTRGRWRSTQENLVVMQAMRRYFDTYEKVTPNFVGKLWLGKAAYAEQPFVGRSTARAQSHLDWTALGPGSTHDVAIVKDGPGRLYYRVGVTYAPKQIDLPALDAGFVVRRTYTPIDSPADVTKLADGRVRVKLGARVLVGIEVLSSTRRHAVAVVDPMPAGFESVNSSLAIAERPAAVPEDTYWDFQNLRDERSEAFAMQLGEGLHRFSYTARATTPGTFVSAPAKAEEMYAPETFGRSTGMTVVIE